MFDYIKVTLEHSRQFQKPMGSDQVAWSSNKFGPFHQSAHGQHSIALLISTSQAYSALELLWQEFITLLTVIPSQSLG